MRALLSVPSSQQVDLSRQVRFRLGALTVEPAECRVTAETSVQLEPRVMQVLVVLAADAPNVVSRESLIQRCWNGRVVGGDAINRVIGRLRSLARGEGAGSFSIVTVNKVGYRLVGEIEGATAASGEMPEKARPWSAAAGPNPASRAANRAPDHVPAIAVLPFGHPADDIEQACFAEGLAEDIIAGLAHARMLRVISPLSSLAYKQHDALARKVCSDLGVRYLVRGKIRRMADKVRLSVYLINGEIDEII